MRLWQADPSDRNKQLLESTVYPDEKIYSAGAAVGRLKRVAPQVKAEIISGAGHDLTMVRADLVIRKVLAFLGEPAGVVVTAA